MPGFEQGLEVSIVAEPPRPIDEVLDEIENAKEGHAEDALADAVERSSETLASLARRFPGKLRVDRFAVSGRPLRAAQYGGLLELVIRLGSVAADLLIEKMSAPQRDVRFYATVCTPSSGRAARWPRSPSGCSIRTSASAPVRSKRSPAIRSRSSGPR